MDLRIGYSKVAGERQTPRFNGMRREVRTMDNQQQSQLAKRTMTPLPFPTENTLHIVVLSRASFPYNGPHNRLLRRPLSSYYRPYTNTKTEIQKRKDKEKRSPRKSHKLRTTPPNPRMDPCPAVVAPVAAVGAVALLARHPSPPFRLQFPSPQDSSA